MGHLAEGLYSKEWPEISDAALAHPLPAESFYIRSLQFLLLYILSFRSGPLSNVLEDP